MTYDIPFNRPWLTGRESGFLKELEEFGHFSGDGPFTKRCQALLERELGVARVLLTTSGTHALELAAMLLDLNDGDEVILPSFTFPSTANAFVLRGARPVFVDVRDDTLNIDEGLIMDHVTERTRAIVPVHYAGVACEMDQVMAAAERYGVVVVEDNALGLFSRYRGRALGTFGELAAQSFHETKSFSCGEGGALFLNDGRLVERAEILSEKGTNRSRFFRGQVDKYTWVDIGSSYLLSDVLAAFLWAQLEERENIIAMRRAIWLRYAQGLASWAKEFGVKLPTIPHHCEVVPAMFYMLMPSEATRARLIDTLKLQSILSTFHYVPLHLAPMGVKFGYVPGALPITEDVNRRVLRLPFYNGLSRSDQDRVIDSVLAFSI